MSNLQTSLTTLLIDLQRASQRAEEAVTAYNAAKGLTFSHSAADLLSNLENEWLEARAELVDTKALLANVKAKLNATKNQVKPNKDKPVNLIPKKDQFKAVATKAKKLKKDLAKAMKEWGVLTKDLKKAKVKTKAKAKVNTKAKTKTKTKTQRVIKALKGNINMNWIFKAIDAYVASNAIMTNSKATFAKVVSKADPLASAKLTAIAEARRQERRKKQQQEISLEKMDTAIQIHKEIQRSIQDYNMVYNIDYEFDLTSPFDQKLGQYRLQQNPICFMSNGGFFGERTNNFSEGERMDKHSQLMEELKRSNTTDKVVVGTTDHIGDNNPVVNIEVTTEETGGISGQNIVDANMCQQQLKSSHLDAKLAYYQETNGKTIDKNKLHLSGVDWLVSHALTRLSVPNADKLSDDQYQSLIDIVSTMNLNEGSLVLKGPQSELTLKVFSTTGQRTMAAKFLDSLCTSLTDVQQYGLSLLNANVSAPIGPISHIKVEAAKLPLNVENAMKQRGIKPREYVVYDSRIPVGKTTIDNVEYYVYLADAGSDGTYNATGDSTSRQGQVRGYFLEAVSRKKNKFNPHVDEGGAIIKGVEKSDLIGHISNGDGTVQLVKDVMSNWDLRDKKWDIAVLTNDMLKGRGKQLEAYKKAEKAYKAFKNGDESVMGKAYVINADVYEWFIRNIEGDKMRTLATSFQETIFWSGPIVECLDKNYIDVDSNNMVSLMETTLYRAPLKSKALVDELFSKVNDIRFVNTFGGIDMGTAKFPYRTISESTNSLLARIASSGTQRTKRILKEAWNVLMPLMMEIVMDSEIQYNTLDQNKLKMEWFLDELAIPSNKHGRFYADKTNKHLKDNLKKKHIIHSVLDDILDSSSSYFRKQFMKLLETHNLLDGFKTFVGWDENINTMQNFILLNKTDNDLFFNYWQDILIPELFNIWKYMSKYVLNPLFRSVAKARVPVVTDGALMVMNAMPWSGFVSFGKALINNDSEFQFNEVPYNTQETIDFILKSHLEKLEKRKYKEDASLTSDSMRKRLIELYISLKDSNLAGFFVCNPCEGRDRNSDCDGDDTTCDPSLFWVNLYAAIEEQYDAKPNAIIEMPKSAKRNWSDPTLEVSIMQADGTLKNELHPKAMNIKAMLPSKDYVRLERLKVLNETLLASLQGATGLASNAAADLYMRIDWEQDFDMNRNLVLKPTIATTKAYKLWIFYSILIEIFISNQKRNIAFPFVGDGAVYKIVDAFLKAGAKGEQLPDLHIAGTHIATMQDELYGKKYLASNYTLNPKLVYQIIMEELHLDEICYWKASSKDGSLRCEASEVVDLLNRQGVNPRNRNFQVIMAACKADGWRANYRGSMAYYAKFAHKCKEIFNSLDPNTQEMVNHLTNRVALAFRDVAKSRLAKGEDQDISKMSSVRRGNTFLQTLGFFKESRDSLLLKKKGESEINSKKYSFSPEGILFALACAYDKTRPINAMEIFISWFVQSNELSVEEQALLSQATNVRDNLLKQIACMSDKGKFVNREGQTFKQFQKVTGQDRSKFFPINNAPKAALTLPVSQWNSVWEEVEIHAEGTLEDFSRYFLNQCLDILGQEGYTFAKYCLSGINRIRKVATYHSKTERVKIGKGYVTGHIQSFVKNDHNDFCLSKPSQRGVKRERRIPKNDWHLPLIGNTDPVNKAFASIKEAIPFAETANLKLGFKIVQALWERNPNMLIQSRSLFGSAGWADAKIGLKSCSISKPEKKSDGDMFKGKLMLNSTFTSLLSKKDYTSYELSDIPLDKKDGLREALLRGNSVALNIKPFEFIIKTIVGQVTPLPSTLSFTISNGKKDFDEEYSRDQAVYHFVKLLVAYHVCNQFNLLELDPSKTKDELNAKTHEACEKYFDILEGYVNESFLKEGQVLPNWRTCEGLNNQGKPKKAPLVWRLSSHSTFKYDEKKGWVQTVKGIRFHEARVRRVLDMIKLYRKLGQ